MLGISEDPERKKEEKVRRERIIRHRNRGNELEQKREMTSHNPTKRNKKRQNQYRLF